MNLDPTKQSIVRTWDQGVSDYDQLIAHGRVTPAEAEAWKAALREILPAASADILEVGAGTGVMSVLIAELGHRVTATDLSHGMLDQARRKAAQRNLSIAFEMADAEALPFADRRFDAVFARHVLWTMPHPERALAEWRRVVKPLGRLVIVDSLAARATPLRTAKRRAGDLLRRLRRPAMPSHHYEPAVRAALPLAGCDDPERYIGLIRAAGLELLDVRALHRVKALELRAMSLADRWVAQDEKYAFVAQRPNA